MGVDDTWHVLKTADGYYKPIYFVVNGNTGKFHCKNIPGFHPYRYRKYKNAVEAAERLNRRAGK